MGDEQAADDAVPPEAEGLAQQLGAPVRPVAQRLVVAEHRGPGREPIQALVAGIHIAQTARIRIGKQHVVPGRIGAGPVGQRPLQMDVGHQPGRPVQPARHRAQEIRRIAHHACRDEAGQGHDAARGQPALVLLAAMVVDVDLHTVGTFGDG